MALVVYAMEQPKEAGNDEPFLNVRAQQLKRHADALAVAAQFAVGG